MDETLLMGLVVLALLVAGAWLWIRRRQSAHLEKSFGPEYRRAVEEHGSRSKAEAELLARRKRVEKLHLVTLAPEQAAR